ncbi:TetR/AcrR family transcriptional regulator [Streptacidiphilus fuscans]|uniref:TetR family transcriptional regulator n=1 Tax=Streptacidiphilus fuscans TaxID=2789292 RepID=A0A931B9P7_9ACTN|nr:TetR family transcriptional regulator [Streptacidiphilus fuscans]MBF9071202.1 TetR family transcriptional regulator [Streptacidiphilus fuscans]
MSDAQRPDRRAGSPAAGKAASKRTGRRPGGADTRGVVLDAARAEFAARGYEKASMRGIARVAGVDPALLHHYFGSKEQLFLAALDFPIDPATVAAVILDGDRAEMGERVARFVVALWEQPEVLARLLAVVRTVVASEAIAELLRDFMLRELVGRLAQGLGVDRPELRVELVISQIIGLAMARYILAAEPIASADPEELVSLLAPTIQRYLTD